MHFSVYMVDMTIQPTRLFCSLACRLSVDQILDLEFTRDCFHIGCFTRTFDCSIL